MGKSDAVHVIGAGLAGCEAAFQIASRGVPVRLYEMKPKKYSPAHSYPGFAELVCSNSLRAARISNAVGLLKEEMRRLNSLIMREADAAERSGGRGTGCRPLCLFRWILRRLCVTIRWLR